MTRGLLVAEYPEPKRRRRRKSSAPAGLELGAVVTVSGTFVRESPSGFGASNGLIVHKKLENADGKVLMHGNLNIPGKETKITLAAGASKTSQTSE